MPFTSNKGFSVPATGTLPGTWGSDGTTPQANSSNALNEGVTTLIDQALGGLTALTVSGSNVNLTQQQAQNACLRITGTLTANIAIGPAGGVLMTGFYFFENLTSGSFSINFANAFGSVALPQGRRGILWVDSAGPRIVAIAGVLNADVIPTGFSIPFYNSTAPTGWSTLALGANDYTIRMVTSGGGGVAGGSQTFSTVFGRTQTDGHTLTTAQIPSHTHGYLDYAVPNAGQGTTGSGGISQAAATATARTTDPTGGGSSHSHNIDMRVFYLSMVLGTRV